MKEVSHPAKFSEEIIRVITSLVPPGSVVLDPMGGVGRIHRLDNVTTIANEIEFEWAVQGGPRSLVGNALCLPFREATFDAVCVSPVYGNRMCLTGETLIGTEKGYRPIKDVVVGDQVITHLGRLKKVTWSGRTGYRKDLYEVSPLGRSPIKTTSNHQLLTTINQSPHSPIELGEPRWVAVDNLTIAQGRNVRNYTASPINFHVTPPVDQKSPEFWRCVGRWLGDGWTYAKRLKRSKLHRRSDVWIEESVRRAYVGWCESSDKADVLEAELRAVWGQRIATLPGTSVTRFLLYDASLLRFLETNFGKLAHGKTLPLWTLGLSRASRSALLEGWLAADGCEVDRGSCASVVGVTVSHSLALGMQLLAQGLGHSAAVKQSKVERTEFIVDRQCVCRPAWRVSIYRNGSRCHHIHQQMVWNVVRTIKPLSDIFEPVYDLEVEDDHSFIANGIVVHNSDHHEAKDKSKRHTYRHYLGRKLHKSNSGQLQWGQRYRDFHVDAWLEVQRVVKPGGWFILNTSDHYRNFTLQEVTRWHHQTLEQLGFSRQINLSVSTKRNKHGANHSLRPDHETVAAFIR